jgi:hypothetical protein
MFRLRLAACSAVVAALTLVPAAGHAATGGLHPGSSCANPRTWDLSKEKVAEVRRALQTNAYVTHAPVRIFALAVGQDSLGSFTVTASRRWRLCTVRGISFDGSSWELPGTVGAAHRKSFVSRGFPTGRAKAPRSLVVTYARRTASDGSTCSAPRAAYVDPEDTGTNDRGASVSWAFEPEAGVDDGREYRVRSVASWQLAGTSKLCYVKGWTFGGRPFTVRHGGDGSYPMDDFGPYPGNHYYPVAYLVIAFAR